MTKIKHAHIKNRWVTIQNDLGGGLFCATISGYHQKVVDDDQIGGIKMIPNNKQKGVTEDRDACDGQGSNHQGVTTEIN